MKTRREHGMRAMYRVGCRCVPCRASNANYEAHRHKMRAYGQPAPGLVDVGPAREHARALIAAGMVWHRIAVSAGLGYGTVHRILGYGADASVVTVRPETAERLLAVTLDFAPGSRVAAIGTTRRLQALVAVGWPQQYLAERMSWWRSNFAALIRGERGFVAYRTATVVRGLYDELWEATPPDPASARARAHAARFGWAPPSAWDDDTIDDPTARPSRVGRRRVGRRRVDLAEVEHLAEGRVHIEEIAQRMGVTVGAIEQARTRARRRAG